ncbi:hypothetical protein [Pseudonocardia asaccharolytica]|uniref:Integrase SAM-like N-terminal domain-containing protein n=1 Tax=Pseudonocardia asaccharolytica DSM 44247 = NBRC 16224 TaxID=1123024 RepID=A0A511CVP9_9PSEU|nr:hypothetical protein [Pseudonocardia asaccharolytica]GEL16537.1 hypothetical protein PA7_03740 [Pseudonocardia asaccharolytica DSM 44247 = NBRC 16224]
MVRTATLITHDDLRVPHRPRGALRVSVYAGVDPLTECRHYLRETVPAGPRAAAEAQKIPRRLAGQVDERRNPRTKATVDQLLNRHFELLDIERDTVENYRRLARLHIRPLIGGQKIGALDADVFDTGPGEDWLGEFELEVRDPADPDRGRRCHPRCTNAPCSHRTRSSP